MKETDDKKDKNEKNPLEELQKHFQEILGSSSLGVNFSPTGGNPFTQSMKKAEEGPTESDKKAAETLERIKAFNLKPKEVRDYLNRFVIKQDEAKKVLSVAICDHYNHVRSCIQNPKLTQQDYSKPNILLLGSTGVGKTYLMRTIAKLIGVPFVKADATKFSETGYVGNDVEDLVRDLVKAANGNIELAEYGIIYIDEIDKIASDTSSSGRDVSGRGVQINLLKLMEETEVNALNPTDIMSQMRSMMDMPRTSSKSQKKTINTRHILFIVSGAFDKLSEKIQKRVVNNKIGFGRTTEPGSDNISSYLHQASTKDFIDYGFEPEFVGRLPVRVACESLDKDDLSRILTSSEGSILRQYENDFKGYEIELKVTPEAIDEIASKAAEEKTGARGLLTVLEKILREFKFTLPSTAIRELEISTETIQKPHEFLASLLEKNKHLQQAVLEDDLKRFTESFKQEHGFTLEFSPEAIEVFISESYKNDRTIRSLCEEKFKDFQHGLQIIQRNTEQKTFFITQEVAKNPEKELSQWVVNSFDKTKENTESK